MSRRRRPSATPAGAARRAAAAGARASRTSSAISSAPSRRWCRCWTSTRRIRRRSASLDRIYESAGDVREPGGGPAAAHRRSPTTPTSWSSCTCASGACTPRRSTTSSGAIASYLAVLEHESRSREALEALERLYFRGEHWPELYGVYEKLVDIAKDDERRWPTATRAWPSSPPTRSTIARRRSSCGAASSTCAARTPIALGGPGRSARGGRASGAS